MSNSGENGKPFSEFLSRKSAVRDLAYREKLASLRHLSEQAPPLIPLLRLWTGPQTVVFGAQGSALALSQLADHPRIDFIATNLPDSADDLSLLRKVKLKVEKPFVISVLEADEYRLQQVRALGGDAVLLTASRFKAVELQYLIEYGRDLGLESILSVSSAADLEKLTQTDVRLVAGPADMQAQLCVGNWLPILVIDAMAEVANLAPAERAVGVMLQLEQFQD